MSGPLSGVRVLEFGSFISGPYAGMLLADLGAEVIKIEMPGVGDPFRESHPGPLDLPSWFIAYNRGKKSVTCNVSSPAGRDIVSRLVATADVLLENFRPGTLDRYGIGWSTLSEINPRLVYCAVTGMGSTGPYSARPSYDAIGQALSGLWSQFTDLAHPEPLGPPTSDQLTGIFAAYGVLAALVSRGTTGVGQRLETSQMSSGLAFMVSAITNYLVDGEVGDRTTRARFSLSFAFVAGDGLPLAVHLSSPPKFWEGLAGAISRADLIEDPRFRTRNDRMRHYDELRATLQDAFGRRPRAEWLALLQAADVPSAPIHDVPGTLDDPQTKHLGMLRTFGAGARARQLVGFPVEFAATPCEPGLPPPALGEHTNEVLASVGYAPDEIAAFTQQRAI